MLTGGLSWIVLSALLAAEGQPPPAEGQPPPAEGQPPPAAEAPPPPSEVNLLRMRVDELSARLDKQAAELEAERAARAAEAAAAAPEDVEPERPMLRLYGFADAGVQRTMPVSTSVLNLPSQSRETTFVVGNLNIYIDAQPSDSWSVLIETRLTNEPDGLMLTCSQIGPCPNQSTKGYESASPVSWTPIRWGSIIIERAQIQWRFADLLRVRLGRFLTPFGIWNIDHGQPTLISLMVPNFMVNELIPARMTGLELLGNTSFGDWEAGYHGYVSNGRTSAQLDPTDDKMLGGRLFLRRTFPPRWGMGLSGLTGRNAVEQRSVTSLIPYRVGRKEIVAYRENVGGLDLWLDVGPLRLRYEFAIRRVDYERGKRDTHYDVPNTFNADRLEWNTYLLGAYQLPWLGLEPFFYVELYRVPTFVSEGAIIPSLGLNIHFTPFAKLKTQYMFVRFTDLPDWFSGIHKDQDAHVIATRLVLAF